ncbi:hypothetical protein D3C73_1443940 [compost metagenome]
MLLIACCPVDDQRHAVVADREIVEPQKVEVFSPLQLQVLNAHTGLELQRDDAHSDQVAAMDALDTPGNDGFDAQQRLSLGRPVTA